MGSYREQLECLQCSQSRSFVLHGEREQRIVAQEDAIRVARRGVLICGRCGRSSLIRSWTDDLPSTTTGRTRRRKARIRPDRAASVPAITQ